MVNSLTTVNDAEVNHFKKLSEHWWGEKSEAKPLLAMNKLRIPFVIDALVDNGQITEEVAKGSKPFSNLLILDVGCGAGFLTEGLAKLGGKVTGLDPCKELCDCGTEHAKLDKEIAENVTYIVESIDEYSKNNSNKYDLVVASEVIEHVDEPELFVEFCIKALKPGGSLFISTENKTFISWLGVIIVAEYILGIVPKCSHDWDKFVPPTELQRMCEKNNCEMKSLRGMIYNVFNSTWYWFPSTMVNYALHAVKKE